MTEATVDAVAPPTQAEQIKDAIDSVFLRFDHVDRLNEELEACYRSGARRAKPRHLVIFGESGSGKTRLLENFADRYPDQQLADRTLIRVLFAKMPSNPTPRKIVKAIQLALGSPFAGKGEDEDQLQHIKTLFWECGVNVVLMDEVSHLVDRGREKTHYKFGDALKEVVDELKVPFVLTGIPRLKKLFEVNEQLRNRFGRRRTIKPFTLATVEGAKVFRSTVKSFQRRLEPLETIDLTSEEILPCIYFACNGLLRPLVELLKEAVDLACGSKRRAITLATLHRAFLNAIWDEAPEERNPFSPKFNGMPLTGPGEPYAVPERDR